MATKLKNLRVTKVDFVDEGANPDAHIRLFKNREGTRQTQDGAEGKDGSVWRKLLSFIGKAAGMGQEDIDHAMEEIQKGDAVSFREKMDEAGKQKIADEIWNICYALQSSLCSVLYDDDLDEGRSAEAMQGSLDEFRAAVEGSIAEWSGGRAAGIVRKNGTPSAVDLAVMKAAAGRLAASIRKAEAEPGRGADGKQEEEPEETEEPDDIGIRKGDEEEMKIDKSKLTPAERAFLESIEKRCGMEAAAGQAGTPGTGAQAAAGQAAPGLAAPLQAAAGQPGQAGTVAKAGMQPEGAAAAGQQTAEPAYMAASAQAAGTQPEAEDIYKGLHPAVKAELEGLKKFREAAEDKELHDLAGKYAVIGKKAEELVPVLKSLKAVGGTAYSDYIAVLDEAVDIVEKSGAFAEIGKSGHGSSEGGAWAQADAKAVELMKSKTGMTKAQALDEVFLADQELAARCEKEG